jgi:glycolate oxidase iron-sulfur subunit
VTLQTTAPDSPDARRGIFTQDLLDRCISCGFCLPACPTYDLTRVETSSPRGRINLMRAIETGALEPDDPTVVEESSFCLGCRACEPVCPAGVQYGALLEEWRDRVWRKGRRPLKLRALLWAVNRRARVRVLGLPRRHARGSSAERAGGGASEREPASLMLGCFERGLYPQVSRAAKRLAPELDVPARQGCCGALHAHNGELERGRELARELGEALPGTIVTTSGGCSAHIASVLGRERVRELSEWLVERDRAANRGGRASRAGASSGGATRPRIGLQDSCHLRNGLGVWQEPRELIARVGEYVELPSAGACCGAAGTYAVLRPDDSARVLDRHLDEIAAADLDAIVVVNPGCYRQLQQGVKRRNLRTRVLHLAELYAEAGTR